MDVKNLTPSHLVIGIDGVKWIYKNRQKTEVESRIPLLPIPEQILKKYENNPAANNTETLLPVLSNQKMNAYLKEIADLCGINKELTFHIARHTFSSHFLSAGRKHVYMMPTSCVYNIFCFCIICAIWQFPFFG